MDLTSSIWSYWGKTEAEASTYNYHPLVCHCLDAGAVANLWLKAEPRLCITFARSLGLSQESTFGLLVRLVIVHDFGKWLTGFQKKAPSELVTKLRGTASSSVATVQGHGSAGRALWEEIDASQHIAPDCSDEWSYYLATSSLVCAALCHHGNPEDSSVYTASYCDSQDAQHAQDFLGEIQKLSRIAALQLASIEVAELQQRLNQTSWLFNGFVTTCDWLASNTTWFPFVSNRFDGHLEDYWDQSMKQADRALTESGMLGGKLSKPPTITTLCPEATKATPLQQWSLSVDIPSEGPNLVVMEDATGAGKTEAALILASKLARQSGRNRVAFALPTMATANAMFNRLAPAMESLFEPDSRATQILAHSGAKHNKVFQALSEGGEVAQWFAEGSRKRLFSSFSIATVDQYLKSILQIRYQSLRLLAVARTVFIIDEVHAYDAYMHKLICRLLEAHAAYGGSAILLSATLPGKTKQDFFAAYGAQHTDEISFDGKSQIPCVSFSWARRTPATKHFSGDASKSRTVYTKLLRSEDEACKTIKHAAASGRCICWVRNTVNDALRTYHTLKELGIKTELFHSRFTCYDRNSIENKINSHFGKKSNSSGRSGRVLIATQVVEQSLDVDFDEMISDLAPIDLLLQRLGRMRRHVRDTYGNPLGSADADNRGEEVFHVLSPPAEKNAENDWLKKELPGTAAVYENHGQLWLTTKYLEEHSPIRLPYDYRNGVESVYGAGVEESVPSGLYGISNSARNKEQIDASKAMLNAIEFNQGYIYNGSWPSDRNAITRIGEPSVQIRLIRFENDQFFPWPDNEGDWELGEVSVRRSMLAPHSRDLPCPEIPDGMEEAYQKCLRTMPDQSKWAISLPVECNENGYWTGKLLDLDERSLTVTYNSTTGIEVQR